jgi:hypothetical protein
LTVSETSTADQEAFVAQLYAGILGLLAFATCLARGIVHGGGFESSLGTACLAMFMFAAVGLILGYVAQRTVEASVEQRVAAELAAEESTTPSGGTKPTPAGT